MAAPAPNHFSDYGFDPQIDFFQGLDQASMRRNRRDTVHARSVDHSSSSFHFKLQKPISKDVKKKQKQHHHHSNWWRTAFLFFRKGFDFTGCRPSAAAHGVNDHALVFIGSTSSSPPPVYFTDTLVGSTSCPPPPPPEEDIPYVSLVEAHEQLWRNSTSAMPLYLVT